ncbi:MAG TPA: hypothetical protein VFS43_14280 [Polyangiaceae bacterium]|nr:hypothetical protein [Polyangiaceae bacterium]
MEQDVNEAGVLPGEDNDGEGGEVVEVTFQLSGTDRRFLETSAKFLVGVHTPKRFKLVRKAGYTQQEHELGWALYAKAAGQDRPLDQYIDEVDESDEATATAEQMARLRELDGFENLWFPRTKAIIRRVVPPEERERFVAIFFANLDQQPLGPLVVGSVSAFLSRVEGLTSSTLKGASEVRETLRQRGLTDAKIARVRAVLAQVRTPSVGAPSQGSDRRLDAGRRQQKALATLRDWFNDWATTLRPVLSLRDRVALGLTARKRAGGTGEGDGSEGDEGEASGGDEGDELDDVVG